MRTTTTTGRMLLRLAEPMTDAVRAEMGADRARRVYRRTLRTAARARRAARRLTMGGRVSVGGELTAAGLLLLSLAAMLRTCGRALVRAGRRVEGTGPTFTPRPVRAALAHVADLATLRAALSPSGPIDPPAPAEVPDLTGGRSFRAVQWEPETFAEPTAPAAPTGPQPWGVELPTPRRIDTRRAPVPADVPADTTPVVPEPPAPEVTPTVVPEPTPEPVKPTRKPRTRKPAAKTMGSAARTTTPTPAVDLSDVRPMPLARFAAGLNSTRFSGRASVMKGWATNFAGGVRVPEPDRAALAAKVKYDPMSGDRAPDVETVLPTSIDPRPFVLTGRGVTATDLPAVVLTREDGETRTVELRLYRTVLHHCPKGSAVYGTTGYRNDAARPLAVFAGDPTTYTRAGASGVLMPLAVGIVTEDAAAA